MEETERGSSSQAMDSKSEHKIPYIGGVAAVRRSINALKWRHKHSNKYLSDRISAVEWNSRRYKEIMEEMIIHRTRYRKLEERYLQLYELLERDETTNQGYQNEWKETITEQKALERLLETKIGNFKAEEEPDGGGREPPEPQPERKSIIDSEANAVKRKKKELMSEITVYQKRFQRLDENYSCMYQILEDKLENHLQEEAPDGATKNMDES